MHDHDSGYSRPSKSTSFPLRPAVSFVLNFLKTSFKMADDMEELSRDLQGGEKKFYEEEEEEKEH